MNNVIKSILRPLVHYYRRQKLKIRYLREAAFLKKLSNNPEVQRVFYFGVTTNQNLGDRGQVLCIKRWIKENYSPCDIYTLSANAILEKRVRFLDRFRKIYHESDIIIFQSGFNVNDMGANHPYMHRIILENFPDAKILMMPESVYFQSEDKKKEWAQFYNKGTKFLFLARDLKSLDIINDMCPNLAKRAFPDIVTTLIGQYEFLCERSHKVCICRRDDLEKYYSDAELDAMADRIRALECEVTITDTTIKAAPEKIAHNLEWYIEDVIKQFSQYECVVTDRFHGVVFSLIAGTPVVVIKTNNHKVTEALKWFDGIYDEYVYLAKDLDEAVDFVKEIKAKKFDHKMDQYFNEHYFSKLKKYFEFVANS